MARNGGVRYGLLFAVLFAFVSYTTGGSVAGEVRAQLAVGEQRKVVLGGKPLACDPLGTAKVGKSTSYPKSDGFSTYCLSLGDDRCWDNGGADKYHFKGTTKKGTQEFCPRPSTYKGQNLMKFAGELGNQTVFAKAMTATPTKFDRVIVNNDGIWQCRVKGTFCFCRDWIRDNTGGAGFGLAISEFTCGLALMSKPFCSGFPATRSGEPTLPCKAISAVAHADECGACPEPEEEDEEPDTEDTEHEH
jgi:hypothetical protein